LAGKKPDQYQSSPGETEHTGYKGATDADKVELTTEETTPIRSRTRGRHRIPPAVPNPEVARHRARAAERPEHPDGAGGAEGAAGGE
jgi:hypothetical protein